MDLIHEVFGATGHVAWQQEIARAAVIFLYGLALVRVAGRRAFSKWSALDIIVSITVGSNLSRALTGGAPFLATLLATAVLMVLHWILAQLTARSDRFSSLLEGKAVQLAEAGATRPTVLMRHSVSSADLEEALHQVGVNEVEQTRIVILEPSGKITVLK